jgi:Domain of unknown function (DUF4384)
MSSIGLRSAWVAAIVIELGAPSFVVSAREHDQQFIEVTVEKRQGSAWQAVSSQTVFHASDDIRFRLKSQIAGYLYVLNHESGGGQTWLYPRAEQQSANRIEAEKSYLVPDAKGSFTVGGNAGFDITYWMITPEAISIAATGKRKARPSTLLPRCRDALFKSRGVCEDQQAGPHSISDSATLPSVLPNSSSLSSRDLSFDTKEDAVRILTPESPSGSIVYALWIAHN